LTYNTGFYNGHFMGYSQAEFAFAAGKDSSVTPLIPMMSVGKGSQTSPCDSRVKGKDQHLKTDYGKGIRHDKSQDAVVVKEGIKDLFGNVIGEPKSDSSYEDEPTTGRGDATGGKDPSGGKPQQTIVAWEDFKDSSDSEPEPPDKAAKIARQQMEFWQESEHWHENVDSSNSEPEPPKRAAVIAPSRKRAAKAKKVTAEPAAAVAKAKVTAAQALASRLGNRGRGEKSRGGRPAITMELVVATVTALIVVVAIVVQIVLARLAPRALPEK
jgi:hypothetical protein